MNLKNEKGITLISLTMTVIILLILTGVIIYNSSSYITMNKLNNLYTDIELINSKIDEYYLKYDDLPLLCEYVDQETLKSILDDNANAGSATLSTFSEENYFNENDADEEYYVIDLEKIGGISLNYGYDDEYKAIKGNNKITSNDIKTEIYIINTVTHQVYFPHGIIVDGYMYYFMK